MKKSKTIKVFSIALVLGISGITSSCDDNTAESIIEYNITQADKDGLLFMLEEEKLARDTYQYLNNLWNITVFANIKNSEQSHMNAVSNLLIQYNIAYNVLPEGEFLNQDLQNMYNQFVIDGELSAANALQIGALIEDLDIVDLVNFINATSSTDIVEVYETLQCGSRNHLRSFVTTIITNGDTYTPQFLSSQDFNSILDSTRENCN